jgi:glycerol-3-phosphate dehydrogenase
MAQDAVDAAQLTPGHSVTAALPLVGADSPEKLAAIKAPARVVRRYGTEAAYVLQNARDVSGLSDEELLAPIADHLPQTLAELIFGVTHEGAVDVDDLLDRRTRIGLIPADKELARPVAERALALAR